MKGKTFSIYNCIASNKKSIEIWRDNSGITFITVDSYGERISVVLSKPSSRMVQKQISEMNFALSDKEKLDIATKALRKLGDCKVASDALAEINHFQEI